MSLSFNDKDKQRLTPKNTRVSDFMEDGKWRTPYQIGEALKIKNAGTVTSRLRDLKASGSYELERRRGKEAGVHEYRLTKSLPVQGNLDLGIYLNADLGWADASK